MPSGQSRWNQILNIKRQRKMGDLNDLGRKLWRAILAADIGMTSAMEEDNSLEVRTWCTALNQLAQTYAKLLLDAEIDQRLSILEERFRDDHIR
jgi:hypothetical protein